MKAIFLGKFQPPHLGHIRTILKIAKQYEAVIVGITMGSVKALEYVEVKGIMDEVFEDNPKITVALIEGTIEGNTSNIDDLDFDVVVSGNNKVLNILESKGYRVAFQPRTEGIGNSGSEIRGLIESSESVYIENRHQGYDFKILPLSQLKPLEKVLPAHLKNIETLLRKDGMMKRPIIIDAKYGIVLDGSHRYAFLLKEGYQYAPVIVVNYDDDAIFVGNHLKHRYLKDKDFVISKSGVVTNALNENLYAARTTRHFFPFRKTDYCVPLDRLEKGPPRNIDYLLEDCSIEEEMKVDEQYVGEIDEELDVISRYAEEQKGVREYLLYQISQMNQSS